MNEKFRENIIQQDENKHLEQIKTFIRMEVTPTRLMYPDWRPSFHKYKQLLIKKGQKSLLNIKIDSFWIKLLLIKLPDRLEMMN